MTRYRIAFHSLNVDGPVLWPARFRFQWTARLYCWWLQLQVGKDRWFYCIKEGEKRHSQPAIMLAGTIGAILVRHNVIDQAAIEDPEGYDGGLLKQRVIDATMEISKILQPQEKP